MFVAMQKPGNRVLAFGENREAVRARADENAAGKGRVSVIRAETAEKNYGFSVTNWRNHMTEEEYRLARV